MPANSGLDLIRGLKG